MLAQFARTSLIYKQKQGAIVTEDQDIPTKPSRADEVEVLLDAVGNVDAGFREVCHVMGDVITHVLQDGPVQPTFDHYVGRLTWKAEFVGGLVEELLGNAEFLRTQCTSETQPGAPGTN
jgi:hypothetical protein